MVLINVIDLIISVIGMYYVYLVGLYFGIYGLVILFIISKCFN